MNMLHEILQDIIHAAIVAGWCGGFLFLYCLYVLTSNGVIQW